MHIIYLVISNNKTKNFRVLEVTMSVVGIDFGNDTCYISVARFVLCKSNGE